MGLIAGTLASLIELVGAWASIVPIIGTLVDACAQVTSGCVGLCCL